MNEHNENDNTLAGEYVLGTLQGEARVRFEQRMQREEALRSEVQAWENRLAPMLDTIEPLAPPAAVWNAIEQEIAPQESARSAGFWNSLVFWRNFGMAAAVLLVAITVKSLLPTSAPVSAERMMVVLNDRSQAGWVVAASHQRSFQVQAIQPTPMPQGQVCQLWMEMPDNSLVPLGVLPHSGVATLKSPMPIPQNANYKVSVESLDAMPQDKPLGKIVFEGKLVAL